MIAGVLNNCKKVVLARITYILQSRKVVALLYTLCMEATQVIGFQILRSIHCMLSQLKKYLLNVLNNSYFICFMCRNALYELTKYRFPFNSRLNVKVMHTTEKYFINCTFALTKMENTYI